MKTFYWLVKREFWEHRGGFLMAPMITGGIFLLLNLMAIITGEVMGAQHGINMAFGGNNLQSMAKSLDQNSMAMVGAGLDLVMYSPALIISIVMGFVVFFYALGALYDDRKDRSLLFWKSLPISDTATVLSKLVAATVIAPVIAAIIGTVTGILMLLMYAITLSFHGVGVWHLLTLSHPFQVIANLIGTIPLYVLWALPTVGWLLLCSAWARSKPFLWAVVLPIAVGIAIGWFTLLGTFHVAGTYWRDVIGRLLLSVFPGGWLTQLSHPGGHDPATIMQSFNIGHMYSVLAAPNVWIGVVAGAVMLAGAIWLRRWRDDS